MTHVPSTSNESTPGVRETSLSVLCFCPYLYVTLQSITIHTVSLFHPMSFFYSSYYDYYRLLQRNFSTGNLFHRLTHPSLSMSTSLVSMSSELHHLSDHKTSFSPFRDTNLRHPPLIHYSRLYISRRPPVCYDLRHPGLFIKPKISP